MHATPMPSRRWAAFALALALSASPAAQAQSSDPPRSRPSAHALLIGIGAYKDAPGVAALEGPANDIALMSRLLQDKLGIPADRIVTLRDSAATHTAIRDAFALLATQVGQGDFVYIHYSGHGSDVHDPADPTGRDQTWIPYGSRTGSSSARIDDFDVRDKEIAAWLKPIYDKTHDIVFVSDSCHSATVSRGGAASIPKGVRSGVADERPQPTDPSLVEMRGPVWGVHIGATEDTDVAHEFDPATGGDCRSGASCYGIFTWHWAHALAIARPGQTWAEVFARTYAVATQGVEFTQRPQLTGDRALTILGGGPVGAGATTIAVKAVDASSGALTLGVGTLVGATKGSLYALRSHGDEAARLEIVSVEPFASMARAVSGVFQVGDLVEEVRHVVATPTLRVAALAEHPSAADERLLARLSASLKQAPGVLWSEAGAAELRVHVTHPRCGAAACADAADRPSLPPASPDAPPEAWLTTRDDHGVGGRYRYPLAQPDQVASTIALLRRRLAVFARTLAFERLESPTSASPVHVALLHRRPDRSCATNCTFAPSDRFHANPLRDVARHDIAATERLDVEVGDVLTFEITNADPDDAWHVYIVDVDRTTGGLQPIFPAFDDNAGAARIAAGEPGPNLARTHVLAMTSAGIDVVKVLVTSEPLDPAMLDTMHERAEQRGAANGIARLMGSRRLTRGDPGSDPVWFSFQTEVRTSAPTGGRQLR